MFVTIQQCAAAGCLNFEAPKWYDSPHEDSDDGPLLRLDCNSAAVHS